MQDHLADLVSSLTSSKFLVFSKLCHCNTSLQMIEKVRNAVNAHTKFGNSCGRKCNRVVTFLELSNNFEF